MPAELLLLPARCAPTRSAPTLPRADLPRLLPPDPSRKPSGRALRVRLSTWGLSLLLHAVILGVLALSVVERAAPRRSPLRIAQANYREPDAAVAPLPEVEIDPAEWVLAPPPRLLQPESAAIEDVELFPDEVEPIQPAPEPFYEVPLRVIRTRVRRAPAPPTVPAPPALPPSPPRRPLVARAPAPRPPAPVRRPPARLRLAYAPRMADYYPAAARAAGQQGTAVVVFLVDESGRVVSTTLERSSGSPLLDAAALQLVRAYRFVPPGTRRRGRLPVAFALQ